MSETLLSLTHVSKTFDGTPVVKDVSFDVKKGECIAIIGSSGSGKSTLLRCINRLEDVTSGQILYQNRDILSYPEKELRSKISMVFQNFNLFNNLDVLGNCVIGQLHVLHREKKEAEKIAMIHLQEVGLAERAHAKIAVLSGGQKQRVAIARALANDPHLILADEPTANLDEETGQEIENLLQELARDGKCVLWVTHDISRARRMDRFFQMEAGKLSEAR